MPKGEEDADDETIAAQVARYPCMPSLVALQQMRNRLHLAYVGKKLMKWTAMATGRELRKLAFELCMTYSSFREDMADAYILLARSRYFCTTMNQMVLENIGDEAAFKVTVTAKSMSGVKVLHMDVIDSDIDPYAHLGIERGGQTIMEAKLAWRELLKRIIVMIEYRYSFMEVDVAHKTATKRSNVISKIIIPRLKFTIKYILSELEENEREDSFRLKRFKELKIKHAKSDGVNICSCCLGLFDDDEDDTIIIDSTCTACQKAAKFKAKKSREHFEDFDQNQTRNTYDIPHTLKVPDMPNIPSKPMIETKLDIAELKGDTFIKHLITHIDDVIIIANQYTDDGMTFHTRSAEDLKTGEYNNAIGSFCEMCRKIVEGTSSMPAITTNKQDAVMTKYSMRDINKNPLSAKSSSEKAKPNQKSSTIKKDEKQVYVDDKCKEIVKISTFKNPDGTMREEKQTITICTQRRNLEENKHNLGPKETKSEHSIRSPQIGEPKLRSSVSLFKLDNRSSKSTLKYDPSAKTPEYSTDVCDLHRGRVTIKPLEPESKPEPELEPEIQKCVSDCGKVISGSASKQTLPKQSSFFDTIYEKLSKLAAADDTKKSGTYSTVPSCDPGKTSCMGLEPTSSCCTIKVRSNQSKQPPVELTEERIVCKPCPFRPDASPSSSVSNKPSTTQKPDVTTASEPMALSTKEPSISRTPAVCCIPPVLKTPAVSCKPPVPRLSSVCCKPSRAKMPSATKRTPVCCKPEESKIKRSPKLSVSKMPSVCCPSEPKKSSLATNSGPKGLTVTIQSPTPSWPSPKTSCKTCQAILETEREISCSDYCGDIKCQTDPQPKKEEEKPILKPCPSCKSIGVGGCVGSDATVEDINKSNCAKSKDGARKAVAFPPHQFKIILPEVITYEDKCCSTSDKKSYPKDCKDGLEAGRYLKRSCITDLGKSVRCIHKGKPKVDAWTLTKPSARYDVRKGVKKYKDSSKCACSSDSHLLKRIGNEQIRKSCSYKDEDYFFKR